jgi:hypothetical protein
MADIAPFRPCSNYRQSRPIVGHKLRWTRPKNGAKLGVGPNLWLGTTLADTRLVAGHSGVQMKKIEAIIKPFKLSCPR